MRALTWTFSLLIGIVVSAEAATTETPVINIPTRDALSLTFSPAGKADVERLPTVSRIRIEIERIGPPEKLSPAMNAYVAWAISPEGVARNIGELSIAEGKGRLETVTPLDRFGLLITAEPHYLVDMPSSYVAYVLQAPRDTTIRRTVVKVETGRYSYANLQPPTKAPGTMTIAVEARTAVEIARTANAERLAENEFRLARVALETMEAMLARSSPPDVVTPTAHDAIRRAASATTMAREFAAGRESGVTFGDDLIDRTSGGLTAAGRDTVQRIAAGLSLWTGPIRIRCSPAAVSAARNALTQAGIPEDRLVFVTLP